MKGTGIVSPFFYFTKFNYALYFTRTKSYLFINWLFSRNSGCGGKYLYRNKDQLWFESNLNTTRYTNGDKIQIAKKASKWVKQDSLPQCAQHRIKNHKTTYYNWYVINDKRGVCPTGWKVPSQKDFNELIQALGGTEKAGLRLKNLVDWGDTTKLKETNLFNAIPTGFMEVSGKLTHACWWSMDAQYKETAYSYSIGNMGEHIIRDKFYKKQGNTIRCMKSLRED